jgi:hypothetical protein
LRDRRPGTVEDLRLAEIVVVVTLNTSADGVGERRDVVQIVGVVVVPFEDGVGIEVSLHA